MLKTQHKPQVLIVLPTLGKRISFLRQTLESISRQQTGLYDLVFIYPLNNNEVSKLAKQYGAASVADPGGLSAAINAGIATAKPHHKYISWIGDDDLLTESSLTLAVQALNKNPHAPVAFGNCEYINDNNKILFVSKAGRIAPWLMTWGPNLLPCPGSLFRKSSLLSVGGFDESNKYSMDLDMFLRLKKLGKFIYINQILAAFRWHPDSLSVASRDAATKEAEIVKTRYINPILRPFSPLWYYPVRIFSKFAAQRLNKKASRSATLF